MKFAAVGSNRHRPIVAQKAISDCPKSVSRISTVTVLATLLCFAGMCEFAESGESQPPTSADGSASAPADSPGGPDSERKEQVATAAVLLLGMVLFIGVALVAWVMVWGGRVRRIARRTLPESGGGDELWYLRAKKQVPGKQPGDNEAGDRPGDGGQAGESNDRETGSP